MEYEENCIRIPMNVSIRTPNLANSVAIVLNEALLLHFTGMQPYGDLHRLKWKSEEV